MIRLSLQEVKTLFERGDAINPVVSGRGRVWFFEFESNERGTWNKYTIAKQRGGRREWADPRVLFDFLFDEFGICSGQFQIKEVNDEEN